MASPIKETCVITNVKAGKPDRPVNLMDKQNMMKKRAAGTGKQGKRDVAWWRQGGLVGYKPSTSSSWKIQ